MIHGSGSSPGGGNGNPLECFCLKNPMERGAWRATVYGVTEHQGVTESVYGVTERQGVTDRACVDGPLSDDLGASLVAQTVRNPPVIHEAQFLPLGREDPLKRRVATHFCVLAWRIPRRIPRTGRLQSRW